MLGNHRLGKGLIYIKCCSGYTSRYVLSYCVQTLLDLRLLRKFHVTHETIVLIECLSTFSILLKTIASVDKDFSKMLTSSQGYKYS